MKTSIYLLLAAIALMLLGCAPKPEPYTVQACISGKAWAEFRQNCTGPRPVEGEEPAPGQFNPNACSELVLRVDTYCDTPAATPVEATVEP